jgi:tRNA(fMet)-specific endonuclease VapC
MIGANDMLVAVQARAIEAICVTDNVAEFKRGPALKVENWLHYGSRCGHGRPV